MSVALSTAQKCLLVICPDKVFEFMKTAAQERNAFEMYRAGLLERKNRMYSMRAGGRSAEFRWAYRRTDAGRAAVVEIKST